MTVRASNSFRYPISEFGKAMQRREETQKPSSTMAEVSAQLKGT